MTLPDEEAQKDAVKRSISPDAKPFSSFSVTKKRLAGTWRIFRQNRKGMIGLFLMCAFVVMAVAAPYIATEDPYTVVTHNPPYAPPSLEHFLGTDEIGRDIFSMLVYGSRVSLIVGIAAAGVAIFLGTIIGLVAGYLGGFVEKGLMVATDFFLVIPELAFMIVLTTILIELRVFLEWLGPLGPVVTVIIVIGIVGWPTTARIVRAQTLSLKERTFVERAKAIGSSNTHIVIRHIFPNVFPLIFANALLNISNAIFMETFLSFLGLTAGGLISWGTMIERAWGSLAITRKMWWYVLPPGICIILIVLAFSLLGYAFEEILNPKLRKV